MPVAGDPRVARAQQIIERNCARLAGLVDDLLDLSRIDSGNAPLARESVDVAAAVDRAAARHAAPMRDRGQTLVLDLPRERLRVDADPARFEQMLAILIGNATTRSPADGQVVVAAQARGDTVEISVRDSGAGISDDMQPLLFDLFDKASDASASPAQGLGTGLAIVARLARLHGGSVSVDSQGPDNGSRFVLSLPAARREAATSTTAEPAGGPRRAVRLLVVDDNVDAADAIATLLSLTAYEVMTAHNPDEAMERGGAFDPDVILLDIGLPGMTGYELARKLHAHPVCRRAKLIAITGYGQPGDTDQAREAGFDGYLVLQPFLTALVWAAILCTTTWPLYLRLHARLGKRDAFAALAMVLLLSLLMLAPFIVVGATIADNAERMATWGRQILAAGPPEAPAWIAGLPMIGRTIADYWNSMAHDTAQLLAFFAQYVEPVRRFAVASGASVLGAVLQLALSIFIAWFMFRDGHAIAERLRVAGERIAGERGTHLAT